MVPLWAYPFPKHILPSEGRVWEVVDVVESTWERGEGEGKSEATGLGGALSCPGRVHARSAAFWASRARRVLARAGSLLANGWYRQVQEIKVNLFDMVGEAREE
jgi:hypothetical protein